MCRCSTRRETVRFFAAWQIETEGSDFAYPTVWRIVGCTLAMNSTVAHSLHGQKYESMPEEHLSAISLS